MSFQAKTYYCGQSGGVRKLIDLAPPWTDVSLPANGIPEAFQSELFDIEVDPNNGDKVYVVGECHVEQCGDNWFGIAVSSNGGVTWQVPGGAGVTSYKNVVDAATCYHRWIEVSVVDSNVIYVCGIVNTNTNKGTVIKSIDGGVTFNMCSPLPAVLDGMDVNSIHFTSALVGVIGLDNYICKTIDGGVTWNVMNGGLPLSTSNPFPGTALPIGKITGIHIKNDESYIIGIGLDFIIESVPIIFPAPVNTAGMAVDSWQRNFFQGGNFGIPIGVHLSYLPPYFGNDNYIFISGLAELGIQSNDPPNTWTNPPAPGYQPSGIGFSRIAAHFYNFDVSLNRPQGFYSKGTSLYSNSNGFSPALADELFSEVSPYGINAVWTWYLEDSSPLPTCYIATSCDGLTVIITTTDLSGLIGAGVFNISGYSGCFIASVSSSCTGAIPIVLAGPVYQNCLECNPPPPVCYRLHDCDGVQADIITDSSLNLYVGQVIKVSTFPTVCWQVTISNTCSGSVPLNASITSSFPDCISCSTVCYDLIDCNSSFPPIRTSTDISAYLGKTVTLSNYPGICWLVQQAPNCTGSVTLTSSITSNFVDCSSCLQKCYKLTDCTGVAPAIITTTDLSAYINKVIKINGCPPTCYVVTASNTCTGSIVVVLNTAFDTCETCNPPVPIPEIPLLTRKVQPKYDSELCSLDIIEEVNCGFADQIYNKVIQAKYGINTCKEDELDKYTIKKELLDLNLIYDPLACVVTPVPVVCDPVVIVPPVPVPCSDPTGLVVTMTDPPATSCGIPVVTDVEIVYEVP